MHVFPPDYIEGSVPRHVGARCMCKATLQPEDLENWIKGVPNYGIFINDTPIRIRYTYMDQSRIYAKLLLYTKEEAFKVVEMFNKLDQRYPFRVFKFTYNGFTGTVDESVVMPYKAGFFRWSGDPGITVMKCDDDKKRLIPTYALDAQSCCLPNDMTRVKREGGAVLFGASAQS